MPSLAPIVRIPRALAVAGAALLAAAGGPVAAQCELDKLMPAGLAAGDRAGASVELFGENLLVSRPGADLPGVGADAGSVGVYARLDAGWVEQPPFLAPDGAADDRFGESIALFNELAVVGAPGDDHGAPDGGAAFVFERIGDRWFFVTQLLSPEPTAGAAFGSAVAVYSSTIVVGAPGGDALTLPGAGAAWVFAKQDGAWVPVSRLGSPQPRAGGGFGRAVTVGITALAVGAPGDDGGGVPGAGAAYLFVPVGGGWRYATTLVPAHPAPGDGFGSSVSHSASWVSVGAPGRDEGAPDAGGVSVFQKNLAVWFEVKQLRAPVPSAEARFGARLTHYNSVIAVAAPAGFGSGSLAGEVHVYRRVLNEWVYKLSTHASDAAERDGYGLGLDLWDGHLLVGAPDDDDVGISSGAGYVVQPFGQTVWENLGIGGSNGPDAMLLIGSGALCGGCEMTLTLEGLAPGAPVTIVAGFAQADLPFQGGLMVPRPDVFVTGLVADGLGQLQLTTSMPTGVPTALQLFVQGWAGVPGGLAGSNAVLGLPP